MKREWALETVKPHLTEHRYVHTVGVMETAIDLARRFGGDVKKAELAAIFHDYAKFRDKQEMTELMLNNLPCGDMLFYGTELLHAPCGAYYVQHEVGIDDADILQAIRYHTTGRMDMTLLEKIIFLADYIEPNRSFPGVEEVRGLAEVNLDEALVAALANTVMFLMKKKQKIYPDTLAAYNYLLMEKKNK